MPTHASSGIREIAAVTAGSIRAVTENLAPPALAAVTTAWL
ncbi:hypothetical protein [Ornithinimicrobium panacihumi]